MTHSQNMLKKYTPRIPGYTACFCDAAYGLLIRMSLVRVQLPEPQIQRDSADSRFFYSLFWDIFGTYQINEYKKSQHNSL